ncbi:MAG: putative metal-binding motif-containing protein, partial [Myxococcota bacterium]|nr:putative metal-binding motif-containing protein [Myxococcota bacterium]
MSPHILLKALPLCPLALFLSLSLPQGATAQEVDLDEDGFIEGDCDPENGAVYPGAPELCDGLDNDCNPVTLDGQGEPLLGEACDGEDLDLCPEGAWVC